MPSKSTQPPLVRAQKLTPASEGSPARPCPVGPCAPTGLVPICRLTNLGPWGGYHVEMTHEGNGTWQGEWS